MWKVLGVETTVPKTAEVWQEQMVTLSRRKKDRDRFLKLLSEADVRYALDGIREVHVFTLTLPTDHGHEDLEFLKGFILKIIKAAKLPMIEVDGVAEKCGFVIAMPDDDDYKERRRRRIEMKKPLMKQSEEGSTRPDLRSR